MWSRIGNSKVRREIANRAIRRWSSSALSSVEPSSGGRFAAVWGNGDFGRLGHGKLESLWRPKPVAFSGFKQQRLKSVACGGAHTLFLTESGQVYATGLNDHGQLGISDKMYTTGPVEVSGLPEEIVEISAGYHHSCAITVDGDLYMWGNNSSGQLGLGMKSAEVVPVPTKVECLTGMFVKRAALGSEHSIAVTDEGDALSWGSGGSGRLGHGHQSGLFGFSGSSSEYTPRLINKLEGLKVKNIAAGLLHSACIDENGSVFLFGEIALRILGIGGAKDATTPSMIDGLPYSEEVACGGYHTCVVTCGGELYTWGSNENGCLGNGSTDAFHLPERVEGPFVKSPVSKVSCGWKHTAAISDGKIFTWGWGGSQGTFSEDGHSSGGQLFVWSHAPSEKPSIANFTREGHGDDVDYVQPAMVYLDERVKAVLVSCGLNHTGAIFEFTEA